MTLWTVEDQGLPTDCLPHIQLSPDRGVRSFRQFRCNVWLARWVPTGVFCFINRDYHHKSVATQIPHDTGLTPKLYSDRIYLLHRDRTNVVSHIRSSKLHALNRLTTGPECLQLRVLLLWNIMKTDLSMIRSVSWLRHFFKDSFIFKKNSGKFRT